jgi:hypothetical protein
MRQQKRRPRRGVPGAGCNPHGWGGSTGVIRSGSCNGFDGKHCTSAQVGYRSFSSPYPSQPPGKVYTLNTGRIVSRRPRERSDRRHTWSLCFGPWNLSSVHQRAFCIPEREGVAAAQRTKFYRKAALTILPPELSPDGQQRGVRRATGRSRETHRAFRRHTLVFVVDGIPGAVKKVRKAFLR